MTPCIFSAVFAVQALFLEIAHSPPLPWKTMAHLLGEKTEWKGGVGSLGHLA